MKRTPSGVQARVGIMLLQCKLLEIAGRDWARMKTFSFCTRRLKAPLRRVVWIRQSESHISSKVGGGCNQRIWRSFETQGAVLKLTSVDWLIMLLYFVFVLGIGFALKRYMKTSKDFFQAGRALPAWICGLAFISANLGAQEVIGMGASGAKYGIATSHFYWIGAIPAMIFVGIFMMPFYYGSKARSVPEFLRLRFDEK